MISYMKHLLFLLSITLVILTFSCDSKDKSDTTNVNEDFVLTDTIQSEKSELSNDSECVFDTSTFKFTTEAIKKFDSTIKYEWNDKDKEATVPFENGDTLFLHIGGCVHFNYFAIYKMDSSKFNDDEYMFNKTIWLAKNFFSNGFDEGYSKFITNKQFELFGTNNQCKTFMINPDSTIQENEIYDGFSFCKRGNRSVITLLGYVN
jgi:hypothetical protein